MRKVLAVGVAVLGLALMACQPAEPAMTITAKVYDEYDETPPQIVTCGYAVYIKGKVSPATGTKTVVLQRTSGGKWVDEKGWDNADAFYAKPATVRQASVSQTTGAYKITYLITWVSTTKHLRVRSSGGGAVSSSIYIKPIAYDGVC